MKKGGNIQFSRLPEETCEVKHLLPTHHIPSMAPDPSLEKAILKA